MQIIRKITEDEMILEFLKAEFDSTRFKENLIKHLKDLKESENVILAADLTNSNQNQLRKKLFGLYRDYGSNDGLFEGFPTEVEWFDARISKFELLNKVYYIDYSYWNELSNGTRLPKDAVPNIINNVKVFNVSNDGFISASKDFKNGKTFAKLILVSDYKKIVVLEGHLRLTAYAMNPNLLEENTLVLIGYSKHMQNWSCF